MKREKQEALDAKQWIRDHVMEEIANHKATFNENNPRDFIDVYIKEQNKSSDIEIFTGELI
jgi:hypothetical protein